MLAFTGSLALAQESATQQQLDKLSGQIQDLLEAQARQNQRIEALEKQVSELAEKVNVPVVNESATHDDLKKLAEQVQDIEEKRQADRELILKQIEQLAKLVAGEPVPATQPSGPGGKEVPSIVPGQEYVVRDGQNLGLIIKACRAQGLKVTEAQMIEANPKMNPNLLFPGQKIMIPEPAVK